MKNIKLIIEYEGTAYGGWQSQTNAPTVQDAVRAAILAVTHEPATLYGAGRTDSGVHALGQVANFATRAAIVPERFSVALNTHLPEDIRVLDSREVSDRFHAQFSACGKHYRYTICTGRQGTALLRRTSFHVPAALDVAAMERAAACFVGTHDFSAFQSAGGRVRNTVRTVTMSRLTREGNFLFFDVEADGFLYNMVRIMVGTLLKCGRGRLDPAALPAVLAGGTRDQTGPTAPAQGLCLIEVFYPEGL